MLPFPSSLNVKPLSSSGQFFSALVNFLFLVGAAVDLGAGRGASGLRGAGAGGAGVFAGKGRTYMVTLGSVENDKVLVQHWHIIHRLQ